MSSIIQSQLRDSKKFLDPERKVNGVVVQAPVAKVDLFTPETVTVIDEPSEYDIQELSSQNQATPGGKHVFNIESSSLMGDAYLELDCSAITGGAGNYARVPGWNMINRITIYSGSAIVAEYGYGSAIASFLTRMNIDEREALYTAAGGNASASGTFMAPLFTPWCSWYDRDTHATPLDCSRFPNGKLRIEVTLRPASEVTASGADTFTVTSKLIFQNFKKSAIHDAKHQSADSKEGYSYAGFDLRSVSAGAFATGVTQSVELSGLNASIDSLYWTFHTAANETANNRFIYDDTSTGYTLKIGSESRFQMLNCDENRSAALRLFNSRYGVGSNGSSLVLGAVNTIALSSYPGQRHSFFGGLAVQNINSCKLQLTSSSGTTLNTKMVAWVHATFHVENGVLVRSV